MGSCGATMHVLCQCPEDEVRKIIGYKKAANRMLLGLSDHDRAFQSEVTVWKLEGELSTLIYSGNSLHSIYFISVLKNGLSLSSLFGLFQLDMFQPCQILRFPQVGLA